MHLQHWRTIMNRQPNTAAQPEMIDVKAEPLYQSNLSQTYEPVYAASFDPNGLAASAASRQQTFTNTFIGFYHSPRGVRFALQASTRTAVVLLLLLMRRSRSSLP
jgi:hypothetical protein